MTKITKEDKKIIEDTNANVLFNNWMSEDNFIKFVDNNEIKNCIDKCTSPATEDIFNAFKIGKPEDVRVLILGQDPYPSGKGTGYAFLLNQTVTENDSLYYILKAIKSDFSPTEITNKQNVEEQYKAWAKENKVLLLNTALTYKEKEKHFKYWKSFVQNIIKNTLSQNTKLIVYLWGVPAQNLFFNILNNDEFKDIKSEILDNNNEIFSGTNRIRTDNTGFKNGQCIISTEITATNLTLYLHSHPSKLNEINDKPFNCYKHFKNTGINWENLLNIYTHINP